MERRNLLKLSLGAPLVALAARAAAATATPERGGDSFSFAFVGDCHIRPELGADRACALCFEQISASPVDFVIQGGDHVEDALETGRARATLLMDLYQRTERAHLRKPVHHVIGNHDCLGVFPKSGIDPSAPDYGKQFYIDRFGPRYYAFDHKGVHFVVLDSIGLTADRNYEGRVDAAQLAWLRADLAAQPKGTRMVVVTHIPLVTAMRCYEPESWLDTPHNWTFVVNGRDVLRILRDYDVLAVLQAHSHVYERIELNGISFITTGAVAGADWRGSFLGTPEGYTDITTSVVRWKAGTGPTASPASIVRTCRSEPSVGEAIQTGQTVPLRPCTGRILEPCERDYARRFPQLPESATEPVGNAQ